MMLWVVLFGVSPLFTGQDSWQTPIQRNNDQVLKIGYVTDQGATQTPLHKGIGRAQSNCPNGKVIYREIP